MISAIFWNRVQMWFKSDISKFVKSVINLIRKGYNLTTIAHSLRQDYFSKNIDTVPHLYIDLADWSLGSQNLGASVQGVQYFRQSLDFFHTYAVITHCTL
jgi:hypothetical protein